MYGFFGACCNWFLGLSAVYGAMREGPEVISLKMTGVMLCYSTLFGRWAGWAVTPRNYVLAGSHMFNVAAQCNQLRRVLMHKLETGGEAAKQEISEMATKAAAAGAIVVTAIFAADKIKAVVAPIGPAYLSSAGGPFTIHPWPPMTKLAISGTSMLEVRSAAARALAAHARSLARRRRRREQHTRTHNASANKRLALFCGCELSLWSFELLMLARFAHRPANCIAWTSLPPLTLGLGCALSPVVCILLWQLDRPTDKISLTQYAALTLTGAIFSRYGLVVTPINYPLTSVNILLFGSSAWHLGRKIKADYL